MISLNNLYYVLYTRLFKPCNMEVMFFYPFGSTDILDLKCSSEFLSPETTKWNGMNFCLMYNEEPILEDRIRQVQHWGFWWFANKDHRLKIIANSEHSRLKNKLCKDLGLYDFYFFFHGLLCLNWFQDVKYFQNIKKFDKPFSCLMNLCEKDRSYRLYIASKLKEHNLLNRGNVSLNLLDNNLIKREIFSKNSKLSKHAKKHIYTHLGLNQKSLFIDTENFSGDLSVTFDYNVYEFWSRSFFHIVPETVFYYNKLHLTEKIFKPIVSKRPFLLVGAPNNLAYLKSYGFKTFDRWIDESYDQEMDNDRRIDKIVEQMNYICSLTQN